jgi:hypothetical protein
LQKTNLENRARALHLFFKIESKDVENYLYYVNNVGTMAIFGKKGPKTSLGTMNRMVTGDGRKNYHTQTSDEISNLSGGIFGKKRRK